MNKNKKDSEIICKAFEEATYVADDLQLKTEIKKNTIAIISTDLALYEKLVKKFPKEKVANTSKKTGKALMFFGVLITVLTGGVLSSVGIPLCAAGMTMEIAGLVAEDYANYTIFMDYDKKQVKFLKTQGDPSIKLSQTFKKIVE